MKRLWPSLLLLASCSSAADSTVNQEEGLAATGTHSTQTMAGANSTGNDEPEEDERRDATEETSPGNRPSASTADPDAVRDLDAGSPHEMKEMKGAMGPSTIQDGVSDLLASCPEANETTAIDTDADGLADLCDNDDDQDGFRDGDDPNPTNPKLPGDFSTPAAIVRHPLVRKALDASARAGAPVDVHNERTSPDISGYFVRDDLEAVFAASSSGTGLQRRLVGAEMRYDLYGEDSVDLASIGFTEGAAILHSLSAGATLRGTASAYSLYLRKKLTCTEGSAPFEAYMVGIDTAEIEPGTGDMLNTYSLVVTVAISGIADEACAGRLGGLAQLGGWRVASSKRIRKVTVDDLRFMCIDEAKGYIPGETWHRSQGPACTCTEQYATTCDES